MLLISILQIDTKSIQNFSLILSKVYRPKYYLGAKLNHILIIIIIFVLTSVFHICIGWKSRTKEFRAFLSLATSLQTSLSFRPLLITSFHVFLGYPLGKLPLTLEVLQLTDQAFSSVLSRWPNHCCLLSSRHPPWHPILVYSPKFLCRNPIPRPNIAHSLKHHCNILL